ncbi:large ribosomal subunit protein mL45 [Sminthopsis crassicaudata]|uniref:large ribosomal subunit protein mL45 n=1 Tax=Sminthopsis crassicaudata TaxID=9301 RepID=UPI003D681C3E
MPHPFIPARACSLSTLPPVSHVPGSLRADKMAAPIRQRFHSLSRALGWCSRQNLEVSCPARVIQSVTVIPVRTKKRYMPRKAEPKFRNEKELQEYARRAGIVIPKERLERPIYVTCTAGIFDAYIPPEGDARLTSLSKAGLKQKTETLKQNVISQLAIRKLREYDADFRIKTFPEKAQQIFIEANQCLNTSDHDRLHALATERCFPEMVWNLKFKTVRWSFVESLEPPRVVHVRCPNMVNEGNSYGQVTVRMHTRQTLAIYDRYGRLMYGQEDMPKDVLEYVVFERHLTNPYGAWRMHGKIVPAWAPSKEPIPKTVMIPGPKLQPWEEYEEMNVDVQKPQPV